MSGFFSIPSPWFEIAVGAYWLIAGLVSAALFAAIGPASERTNAPRIESVVTKRLLHLAFGGAILPLTLASAAATYVAGALLPWAWRKAELTRKPAASKE